MKAFAVLVCLFIVLALTDAQNLRRRKTKKLVIFGDSTSDNGNLKRYSDGEFPKKSVAFTNGKVWNEIVARKEDMALFNNAYGGAAVGASNTFLGSLPVPTLSQQILNAELRGELPCKHECIVTIMIGPNDIITARNNGAGAADVPGIILDIVTGISDSIHVLLDKYKVEDIVVATMFPSSATPLLEKLSQAHIAAGGNALLDPKNIVAGIEEAVDVALTAKVTAMQLFGNQSVKLWDIGKLVEEVESYEDYSLSYCFDFNGFKLPECTNARTNYWWDAAHPSTRLHRIFANNFIDTMLD